MVYTYFFCAVRSFICLVGQSIKSELLLRDLEQGKNNTQQKPEIMTNVQKSFWVNTLDLMACSSFST